MSSGTQPQQTTTTEISPQAKQLFDLAYPNLKTFAASTPQPYQGETVAPFTAAQQQGQSDILAGAKTAGGVADWARAGTEALPGTIASSGVPTSSNIFNDPGIWNPAYNAGTTAAIQAAQRPTWQALTEQALPAIGGGAITAGGYGGSRQGIAEGLATGRATQTASDQAAKIVEDLYGANLGAVNQRYATNVGADVTQRGQTLNSLLAAYSQAPLLQSQALAPGVAESAVGDVQQQQQQLLINEAMAKYYANQYAPFIQSQDILGLLPSIPGATTVSTGNTPQPGAGSLATGALGGAATGAALGSVVPGIGTGIGAGVGAIAGTLPFFFPNK